MSVSQVVKAAMTLQKIDRYQLAEKLGTTPNSLNVKFNRDAWSAGDLIRAAAALGLKVALVDGRNEVVLKFNESDATPPRRSKAPTDQAAE